MNYNLFQLNLYRLFLNKKKKKNMPAQKVDYLILSKIFERI